MVVAKPNHRAQSIICTIQDTRLYLCSINHKLWGMKFLDEFQYSSGQGVTNFYKLQIVLLERLDYITPSIKVKLMQLFKYIQQHLCTVITLFEGIFMLLRNPY